MSRGAFGRASLFVAMAAGGAASCGTAQDPSNAPQSCPGRPIDVPEPNSLASASRTGACEGAMALLTWSDRPAGAACTDARQCKPTCCYCAAQSQSALTSWCNHGRCASPNDVCCAVEGTPLASCI